MLQAFVITFREGLEAFLIIAISLAFLRKSGSRHLVPAVQWGIAVSVVLSVLAGWLFSRASNQALWEGILALVAAVSVAIADRPHVAHRAAHQGRDRGTPRAVGARDQAARRWLGVFLFTLLMISREGMETALLMGTLIFQVRAARHHRRARLAGIAAGRPRSPGSGRATDTASTLACSSR